MSRQPDKIFRDKLLPYQKPVSAEAWKRVSREVRKSDHGNVWLKIAAAILVLAVAGVFLFSIGFNDNEKLITKTNSVKKQNPVASPESAGENNAIANAEKIDKAEEPATQDVMTQRKAAKKREPTRSITSLSSPADEEKPAIAEATAPQKNTGTTEYPEQNVKSQPVPNETETKAKSVTIVFSAREVNEKYLTKKNSPEATSEEKESSTLKKVLDKAYDLTHNQDPMGDLRQKKNEILAMNFKNEKQRNEND